MASFIKSDLVFILAQIKIAEANAAGTPLRDLLPNTAVPLGLRTLSGVDNSLIAQQTSYGSADLVFPRLLPADFNAADAGTSYTQTSGIVIDADPRIISNLIVDQTANNPAAVAAAAATDGSTVVTGTRTNGTPFETLFIPNVSPDIGFTSPYNAFFTFFGQFFDHGLDLINKGNSGTVFIPLKPDDPLFVAGSPNNFMVLTRATNLPGPDGVLGTADDLHENTNQTSPFVDQNQTYTSHPSHQVFLRAYALNAAGAPMDTGMLIDNRSLGADGKFGTADDVLKDGMATWAVVKAQARDLLGILLDDKDALDVPLLAADAYGNFIRGAHGLPQLVTASGLVEGNRAAPVDASLALRSGHPFLVDIAHNAQPVFDASGALRPDADNTIGNAQPMDAFGNNLTYDNELLDAHYIAGDGRANENIGLTSVHEIFHSEHNRQVEEIKATILATADAAFIAQWHLPDGSWNGERLFQAAKVATEMQYQHLVFEEFARKIDPKVDDFNAPNGFDQTINPAIFSEFANTVYRFGHSMLTETVDRLNPNFVSSEIGLIQAFLNPIAFLDGGATAAQATGAIIRGVTRQVGNEIDEFVTEALRNNLLGLPLDLPALNLARGRDVGVPSLNETRRELHAMGGDSNLAPYVSWTDFAVNLKHEESIINFIAAYGTHSSITSATTLAAKRAAALNIVLGGPGAPSDSADFLHSRGAWANTPDGHTKTGLDDVDLWVGGLAENKEPFGSMLGPTFSFIFEKQLENLQNGDRLYYLSRFDGQHFLFELDANTFSGIIMKNTDATHLAHGVFSSPAFTLEVDPTKQFTGLGADGRADPTDTHLFAAVIRDNPLTVGPDTHYLQYTGKEQVVLGGTSGNDTLIGGDSDDDTLYGDAGNDRLDGGFGNDFVHGGAGDDIITDLGGNDTLDGGDGNDVIQGGNSNDPKGELVNIITGGAGKDFIITNEDISLIDGGSGDDFILGATTNLQMAGNEGDDWIERGTQDGAPGDNFAFGAADDVIGNDVFVGGGGFDEMIGEGGDDIFVGSDGQDKMDGLSGFDWTTYKNSTSGITVNMDLNLFSPAHPVANAQGNVSTAVAQSPDAMYDRFFSVEGLSGTAQGDLIRGDNADANRILTFATNGSVLKNFDLITGLRAFVGAAGAGPDGILGNADDQFGSGNILLGGSGSDVIMGGGGDDLIDGDKWLNVRISVRQNIDGSGPQIATFDGMDPLIPFMINGTYNPGQLVAVREILPGTAAFDTAEYLGPRANYTVTVNNNGTPTNFADDIVTVTDNVLAEGTDRLTHIERIQFADEAVVLVPNLNRQPTGTLRISDTTPAVGQEISVSPVDIRDGDNSGGTIKNSWSYVWQVETAPGTGVFDDIILAVGRIGIGFPRADFPTFKVTPELDGLVIRVKGIYSDEHGVTEEVFSAPTAAVSPTVTPVVVSHIDPQTTVSSPGVHYTQSDLAFILDQIKIAERHAAGEDLVTMLPNVRMPYGLRAVDGSDNNLLPNQSEFGGADTVFPRLFTPKFITADSGTTYQQTSGLVIDSDPRTISNLIVDQTANNPAAVAAAAQNPNSSVVTGTRTDGSTFDTFVIPNIVPKLGDPATDTGVSAPFNAWMTFFGQFFDHGLDLVTKGGNGTVFVPLKPDDPLFVPGSPTNFMVLTRATMLPGPDGVVGTADDIHENANTTTPFIDQNQTYTSHPSHQVFLRDYKLDASGRPVDTGKLIETHNLGPDGKYGTADDVIIGGMATWATVKAQARDILGIRLTDADVSDVPLLATDPYGNFIRGVHGLPQVVMKGADGLAGTADDFLVEGNRAAPIDLTNAVRTGHQFIIDINNNAAPVFNSSGALVPDPDNVAGNAVPVGPGGNNLQYDNELLDAHYIAGDGRVNENIGLTTVHQIFHSEHNRLVDYTKAVLLATTSGGDVSFLNEWLLTPVNTVPANLDTLQWNGERLFQAAKFGTEMQYQHLVFEEFARTVQPMVDLFFAPTQVYDTHLNPAITAEFAHTVYRFGHSMLTETVDRLDPNFVSSDIGLIQAFLNPLAFAASGPTPEQAAGAIVRGVTRQTGNEIDEFVTEALRNNLLGLPLDLPALNLARGRDTGIPSLNAARREIFHDTGDSNLTPYTSWADFVQHIKHEESLVNFIAAYGTHSTITSATTLAGKREAASEIVFGGTGAPADRLDFLYSHGAWASNAQGVTTTGLDDIDFWIGGLAEKQKPFGGLLGSTFNFVFENQLEALQNADRFYYLERTAGLNFNVELEANSFSKLVEANTDVTHLPGKIFDAVSYTLEVDQTKQFNDGLNHADPTGSALLTPLVLRDDPSTPGADTHYLKFTGDTFKQVVLGGTEANDTIVGGEGNDTIYGDGGNDRLDGGNGDDTVHGGNGDDILTDKGGVNFLEGEEGNDVIDGGNGNNIILGGLGADFIITGTHIADSSGGPGNDFILGAKANEFAMGGEGDDWIEGGAFDTAAGDNFDPFGNDPIRGNDVFMGDGGADNFDGEGGDDIWVGTSGYAERFIGFSGYDWATFKNDTEGVTAGLDPRLRFFDQPVVAGSDSSIVLRLSLVEGMSGSSHGDYLQGDDLTAVGLATQGAYGSALTNFDLISGLRAFVGAAGAGPDGIMGNADDVFDGGNILLGGAGSDIIRGGGGDDLIDGDKWLNVRLSVRQNADGTGPEIATYDSLVPMQELMLNRTYNPGQIKIVRELLDSVANFDTAEYSGVRANYVITTNALTGVTTVQHIDPAAVPAPVVLPGGVILPPAPANTLEGTDRLTHMERLIFSDQVVVLTPGMNNEAQGLVHVNQFAPRVGDVLKTSMLGVTDADNPGGAITGPVSYFWQAEVAPGTGVFQDAMIIGTAQTTRIYGPEITVSPTLEGVALRVRALYEDGHGVLEQVYSAPTFAVRAAAPGNAAPVGTVVLDHTTAHPLQPITATNAFTDANGIVASSLTYQWQIGSTAAFIDLVGATSATYTPNELDSGAMLRVVVSYTDGAGNPEQVISAPTQTVGALIVGTPGDDILIGTAAGDTLEGLNGNDQLIGLGGDDFLLGGLGNDRMDGGAGADEMVGDGGNDTYVVDNTGDIVTEFPAEGIDAVETVLASYALGANVENLRFTGVGNFSGTGNALANDIVGGAGNDTLVGAGGDDSLNGAAGSDSMAGGTGNDTYTVDSAGDTVTEALNEGIDTVRTSLSAYTLGANLENLTFIGAGGFAGTGNALANTLTGGTGADTLNGGTGADTMIGGAGNDTYFVDDVGDVVTESLNAGSDTVFVTLGTYTLSANVEILTFIGAGNFNGTGNALANIIRGGAGADRLNGLAGADTMIGGTGNDTYVVDNAGDVVTEAVNAGTDTVEASLASYTLAANVENLTFVGAGNFAGTGNGVTNVIQGGAGNDTLNGAAGADTMIGLAGNDTYVVDNAGDIITEALNAGTDTVQTTLASYTLTANVENLTFIGAGNFSGTGNALNNTLTGGPGTDTLAGLAGDDTYVVNSTLDVVNEALNAGTDTVQTALSSYTLGANVENLTFIGAGNFVGTGNALSNTIRGGAGADTLSGAAGADTMIGGAGNDTYVVENAGDVVTELAGGGADTVLTSLASYTLSANVENLTFFGVGNFAATGNALANVIQSGAGADTLKGGAGNDFLNGGLGNDVFVFDAAGFGADRIQGFDALPAGGQDRIDISGLGINAANFGALVGIIASGVNTLVDIGADSILLLNVTPATVDATDFLLAA